MRPVGLDDLRTAARALMAVPPDNRAAHCAALFNRARQADRYVKRLRKLHPEWGDGSLRAAARSGALGQKCWLGEREYRACCQLILSMLDAPAR